MKSRWLWVGAVAVAALAWVAAPELPLPARVFLALLLGPVPVLFMLQSAGMDTLPQPLPKTPVYVGSIIGLWLLAALTIAVAYYSHIPARLMGLHALRTPLFLLWTASALLGAAALVTVFKAFGYRDNALMRDIVPTTAGEKIIFVALSVTAGICEELVFRGFLLTALFVATGSIAAGVLLSSIVFGLLHAHQGAGGALRAALLGVVLCAPLALTGSIYPSMAAHAIADIAGGLWLARWLLR